tara:strand:+ start:79 stop:945 length:867 start_codon:yes stop_codon:yes gene_type:complete
MSGSAANAAARRRRAEATPVPARQQRQEPIQSVKPPLETGNKITPLQILQNHEEQITNLTENLESVINDIMEKKLTLYTEKIKQIILTQEKLEEKFNNLNKQLISSDTNNTTNDINDNVNNIILVKLDEFKNMLIKNQASVLEFSNEIYKMKDDVIMNTNNINNLSMSYKNMSYKENEINQEDKNINSTQMLFESLLKNSLFQENFDNRNILDTDDESEKETQDDSQEINLGEEIVLGEDDLIESVDIKHEIQEIAKELASENKKIDIIEDEIEDKIEDISQGNAEEV